MPTLDDVKKKTDNGELVSKGELPPVDPMQVSQAIHIAEIQESEVDKFLEEF